MSDQQTPPNQQPSLERQDAQRAHDRLADFTHDVNRAAIENANLALRYAVFINGGAAVAILGFIGALAAQGKVNLGPNLIPVSNSLTYFAFGVAIATLAMGFSYFTNYGITAYNARKKLSWTHPFIEETAASKGWKCFAIVFQMLAIIAGFASIATFVIGMLTVKEAITHLS